jgi:hypothetical protein
MSFFKQQVNQMYVSLETYLQANEPVDNKLSIAASMDHDAFSNHTGILSNNIDISNTTTVHCATPMSTLICQTKTLTEQNNELIKNLNNMIEQQNVQMDVEQLKQQLIEEQNKNAQLVGQVTAHKEMITKLEDAYGVLELQNQQLQDNAENAATAAYAAADVNVDENNSALVHLQHLVHAREQTIAALSLELDDERETVDNQQRYIVTC